MRLSVEEEESIRGQGRADFRLGREDLLRPSTRAVNGDGNGTARVPIHRLDEMLILLAQLTTERHQGQLALAELVQFWCANCRGSREPTSLRVRPDPITTRCSAPWRK